MALPHAKLNATVYYKCCYIINMCVICDLDGSNCHNRLLCYLGPHNKIVLKCSTLHTDKIIIRNLWL